jgi:predicted DNA-binding mobile mystery protein A
MPWSKFFDQSIVIPGQISTTCRPCLFASNAFTHFFACIDVVYIHIFDTIFYACKHRGPAMKPPDKLAMKQIERRIENLRSIAKDTAVRTGWIRYMRQAMSMTLSTLAKTVGLNPATVQQIEKREIAGKVTIETMRKIASAMDCEFVYALVPKQELNVLLKRKAVNKATEIVRQADIHMTLEDQRVSEDIKDRIDRIAEDLLAKGDIW